MGDEPGNVSEFCEAYAAVGRSMAVDASFDGSLEEAFEATFTRSLAAAARMRSSAPPEITDAVEQLVGELEAAVAVIERYGWDPTRATVEGSPDDQAALQAMDADSEAQRRVKEFVRANCGG